MTPTRLLAAVVAAASILIGVAPASAAPFELPAPPREGLVVPAVPSVSAKTWILYDAGAGTVLASAGADVERAMASTTKIMTALVALKHGDPDDMVTVSDRAAAVGESEVGLVAGERLRLELLVRALVVRSANDASVAVAEHIAGSVEEFAELMNEEAAELGLTHSHFQNPHGLDAPDHYSSARDLLQIALAAMDYPEFREMAVTTEARFPPAPDGTERVISSTNQLLEEYPGAIGIKTGYTNQALLTLVAAAERDNRTLFSVVMGSEGAGGHFDDSENLLDWGFERFGKVDIVTGGVPYQPAEPERLVVEDTEPVEEEQPVVVQVVRPSDGDPPGLAAALGWVGRLIEQLGG